MKPKSRHLRTLAIASSALLTISYAQAATFTFIVPDAVTTVTDNWSTDTKWSALPVSASDTSLVFTLQATGNSQTQTTNSANNIATGNPNSAFQLNTLTFNSGPSAGNGSQTVALNISGNPLDFVSNGGTTPQVNLTGNRSNGQLVSFAVSNNIVLTNNTLFTGNGTAAFTFSGGISGAGNLSKSGTSKLTLSGTNSYGGTTTISGGILQFTNAASLYNNNTVAGGWTATNIKVANLATLALNVGGANQFTAANVNTLLTNLGGANGSSTTGFAAGSTLALDTTGAGITVSGNIVDSTGTGGGALGVTKQGTNTLTLSGANTYTGTTSIIGGSLTLVPTAGGMNLGAVTASTSSAGANIALTLGGAGTNTITSITETSNAGQQLAITKNTAATWSVGNVDLKQGNTSTVSSGILNLNGTLKFGLGGASTTLRQFFVSGGTLGYNNAGAVQTSGTTSATVTTGQWLTMTGGALDNLSGSDITTSTHNPNMMLNANLTFTGTNSLNFGTGRVSLGSATGTSRTITVSANTLTLGGIISNGTTATALTTLTKAGAGSLTLSGVNTYTGATAVNAGTLEIASTGSINTSSGVTINGGTLRYNSSTNLSPTVTFTSGTIAGTNWNGSLSGQTIGTGQTISPGNSPGTATTLSQTWASGGSYLWEVNNATGTAGADPGWDLETGTGTLDISATNITPFNILVTSLTLANVGGLATNFNDATSVNWLFADFASITGFAANAFNINTSDFDNTFTGTFGVSLGGVGAVPGDNSQIYLTYTAVPEPNVAALIGALGGILLLRRRR